MKGGTSIIDGYISWYMDGPWRVSLFFIYSTLPLRSFDCDEGKMSELAQC